MEQRKRTEPEALSAVSTLERRVGHVFNDRALLTTALTHRSYANESGGKVADNEVLEFLGDAVLGLVVSDVLCTAHPYLSEGQMSKLKSHLVSAETLSRFADEIGVGEFMLLGRGEEKTAGRAKRSILANAVEAIIAALYRDGGLECARRFILDRVEPLLQSVASDTPQPVHDFKSVLQETVQAAGFPLPHYRVVEERGPDHDKLFHVEVEIAGKRSGQGVGPTKKRAEQEAAREALDRFRAFTPADRN